MGLRTVGFVFVLVVEVIHGDSSSTLGKGERFSRSSLEIINGKNASIKDFPYIVSISSLGTSFLGAGVVLNKHWMVTAAYNVDGVPVQNIQVRVGSKSHTKGGQVLSVSKVIVPDQYDSWDWDVAVLKTNQPIRFKKHVKKAKLATKELKKGTKGKIAGWGAIDESFDPTAILQETTLTVTDRSACTNTYGSDFTDRLFCIYNKKTTPDYVSDDFGDPLVVKRKVYGLYAGGFADPVGTYPVLFTSIPKVRSWIKNAISS